MALFETNIGYFLEVWTITPHTENQKVTCVVMQVWHITSHIRKAVDIISLLRKKKIILSIIKIKNLKVEIKVSYFISIHSNPIYLLVCCECFFFVFDGNQGKFVNDIVCPKQICTVHYETPLINILNDNLLMTSFFSCRNTWVESLLEQLRNHLKGNFFLVFTT